MPRSRLITITAVVIAFVGAGVLGVGVGAGADPPDKRPPAASSVVTIDDGSKEVWTYNAWLDVPMSGVTETVGPAIPEGKRLVVETISVFGNGAGAVTEDQGIERVELTAGAWMVAIPLDRYSWGSCPGFEPPENCGNYVRNWKYAGTEAVRAYVDFPDQITAFAEHPGGGDQDLIVQVMGYLVPVPAS